MKLSFYYKKQHPSVLRLIYQVIFYFKLMLVGLLFGAFAVELLEELPLGNSHSSEFIFYIMVVVNVIALRIMWFRELSDTTIYKKRLIIVACVFLLALACAQAMAIRSEWLSLFIVVYFGIAWLLLWPRNVSPPVVEESDSCFIEISSFTVDVARFQFVLIFMLLTLLFYATAEEFAYNARYLRAVLGEAVEEYTTLHFVITCLMIAFWLAFWRRWVFRNLVNSVITIAIVAVSLAMTWVYAFSMDVYDEGNRAWAMPLALILVVLFTALLNRRSHSESEQYRLARISETKFDYTVYCPICHYNLAGLTKLRCPECGTEFVAGRLIEENVYLRNPDLWLN